MVSLGNRLARRWTVFDGVALENGHLLEEIGECSRRHQPGHAPTNDHGLPSQSLSHGFDLYILEPARRTRSLRSCLANAPGSPTSTVVGTPSTSQTATRRFPTVPIVPECLPRSPRPRQGVLHRARSAGARCHSTGEEDSRVRGGAYPLERGRPHGGIGVRIGWKLLAGEGTFVRKKPRRSRTPPT